MDDVSLHIRLLNAEDSLLDGLENGHSSLRAFMSSWSSLGRDIESAVRNHSLKEETISLVASVSARVCILAESFLQTRIEIDSITDDLMGELDVTFTQFGLSDSDPTNVILKNISSTPHSNFALQSGPRSPYDWLLDNLHNPYPSPDVKARLAKASGTSVKSVETWLAQVRQEIGWTTLFRESFSSSRSRIIHAAHLAYLSEDLQHPLPYNIEHAFVIIRNNLKNLPFASRRPDKDAPIADTESKERLNFLKGQVVDGTSVRKEIVRGIQNSRGESDVFNCALSSAILEASPSIEESLFTLDYTDEEEDTTPPPSIAGVKRRFETPNQTIPDHSSDSRYRPIKRSRTHDIDRTLPMETRPISQTSPLTLQPLPSPYPSPTTPLAQITQSSQTSAEIIRPTTLGPPTSRKRRLSDADPLKPEAKRPCGIFKGPRAHIVSDPLPTGMAGNYVEPFFRDDRVDFFAAILTPPSHETHNSEPLDIGISADCTSSANSTSRQASAASHNHASSSCLEERNDLYGQSVSDVLALLPAPNYDITTHSPVSYSSELSVALPNTFVPASASPWWTPQDVIWTNDPFNIDWGHFDDITLAQFPTGESIATRVPCLEGMTGSTQSMSLVDDMLLPFMFNPDMNPPPDTFGLDIYSGFGDQSQTWTGLWDLD